MQQGAAQLPLRISRSKTNLESSYVLLIRWALLSGRASRANIGTLLTISGAIRIPHEEEPNERRDLIYWFFWRCPCAIRLRKGLGGKLRRQMTYSARRLYFPAG